MDQYVAAVQSHLIPGEKCHFAVEAGLVQDWVKTTRILSIIEKQTEYGLFIFTILRTPVMKHNDIHLENVLPINNEFKCELDSGGSENLIANDIYIKITLRKMKYLFEMPFNSKANHFVSEISKATEIFSRRTYPAEFSWLQKYIGNCNINDNPFANDVFDPFKSGFIENSRPVGFEDDFSDVQLRHNSHAITSNCDSGDAGDNRLVEPDSPDTFKHLPRQSIAVGATPLAARDSVIRLQMTMREEEYTNLQTFRIFVGTWNVNGQTPAETLTAWLASDPEPPDIYAIGFQELDLSKEAFLFNDTPREEEWRLAVVKALQPKAEYYQVKLVRLVGMMLIVFAQQKHLKFIKNIAAETVGTGLMGKMGNKGGVSVRFDIHNTSICFVNSHLAAHTEEYERRNQDYNDICSRMSFSQFIPPKSIKDHDQIYWLGDLNYRISGLESELVKTLIDKKKYSVLLESDQLIQQHKLKKVYINYLEGAINFNPTYKYDPGTDKWDTSDKCRTPAWCDRILWRGNSIQQKVYRSHMSLKISDHKPVSAIFESGIKVINRSKYRKIYEEVMKKLDKLENEFLPQVTVDNMEIRFDKIRFMESQIQYLTIANTGQVPVQFEFIKKLNDTSYCKEWLKITPFTSPIKPGEKCDVELEVCVTKHSAHKLNCGEDKLEDILVLHLEGGKDIFITVYGKFESTCFGISLENLVRMNQPVREVPVGNLIDVGGHPVKENNFISEAFDIPKEIWLLVDHLFNYFDDQEHLFEQPGLNSEILAIRECLDTGVPDKLPGSVHSVAEALLLFLEALPEPVIPYSFYNQCLESANNFTTCKQFLAKIPEVHRNVFKYLTSFLKQLLSHSDKNKLDIKTLSTIFGRIFIRAPQTENENPAMKRSSSQAIDKKKATFVYHFLVNDYDG